MPEKEYIERERIYRRIKTHTNPYGKPTLNYESGVKVLDMIKSEPAADVVEKNKLSPCDACAYYPPSSCARNNTVGGKDYAIHAGLL